MVLKIHGQCHPCQECAGTKDGRKRQRVDCSADAARIAEAKFCARYRTAGFAQAQPGSYQFGGRTITPEEPHPKDSGRCQYQVGVGGQRHPGKERSGHADRYGERSGKPGRVGRFSSRTTAPENSATGGSTTGPSPRRTSFPFAATVETNRFY